MLVGRTTYDAVKQRQKSTGELSPKRIPLSSEFMSSKNSLNNIERPLKSNQNDLSFKGLSFKGENKPKKKDDKMKPLLATFGVLAATGLALRFAPRYKEAGKFKVTEFLEDAFWSSLLFASVIQCAVGFKSAIGMETPPCTLILRTFA